MMKHQESRAFSHTVRLFAILVGLVAFFSLPVGSAEEHEADLLIPIITNKLPEGLTLVGPPLKELEIRVQGAPSGVAYLTLQKPQYRLDLSSVTIGVESIPVNPDIIPMPEGVKITRVNPAYITIRVDRWLKKAVPVKINVSGKPAAGFFVDDVLAEPSTIMLCGPETVLGSVDAIVSKPIDISGRSQSFKKEMALELTPGIEVCASSGIILAEIYITEKALTRQFADIRVEGHNTPYEFSISPPTINIEIKGPQKIVQNLHPQKDISVLVELKDLSPGVYVRRATITLPLRTTLVKVEPELFTVKISGDIP